MTTATLNESKQAQAEAIINKYVPWSMGAGFVPVPLLDVVALTGIQVKMLAEISALYGVQFAENRGKSIVVSLLGGLGSTGLAAGALGSLVKAIPGVGMWVGAATLPVLGGAVTFAVGKVFIQHFESGGTFLNFDSMQARKAFAERFEEGKKEAVALGQKVDAKLTKATASVNL
jgi:uncharacterized protein (DUF697 family)